MSAYTVRALRWDGGWELHIAGVGVTQCRRLREAEAMVRDYLHLDGHTDAATADVVVVPEVAELAKDVRRAREQTVAAEAAQATAAASSRRIARRLKEAGLTGSDVAAVMGVTQQRASQLLRAPAGLPLDANGVRA